MRTLARIACVSALLASVAARAYEVIAYQPIDLTVEEVRDVFLGELQFVGDLQLVPVDNTTLHTAFLQRVLQTDGPKYHARWSRKAFREGISTPAQRGSDEEVIDFVKATPGAIGYVAKAPPGVVVLLKF